MTVLAPTSHATTCSSAGRRRWRRSSPSCATAPRSLRPAAARHRSSGIARAASCPRASASTGSSIRAPRSSSSTPSPHGSCTTDRRRRPDRHRDRRRRGARMRRRRERRDREGRHVLPADREEAPTCAGGRGAEPPPVHLPRRLGRRVPSPPGRGVPGPRTLRPDLLQPGAHVRQGDPADRGRDGLLHGRRRLCPGDVATRRSSSAAQGRSSSAARRS